MTAVLGFQHAGIVVRDLEGALGFYRDVLGLAVLKQWRGENTPVTIALLGPGDGCLELLSFDETTESSHLQVNLREPGLRHIALQVDDLDTFYRRVSDAGLRILYPPRTGQYFTRYFFCEAPEGVLIEFLEA